MNKLSIPKWLYIPICTPLYKWEFDVTSYKRLMYTVEENVDWYVPCLSSWEWQKMTLALWKKVLIETLANTEKPVYVWIKRDSIKETLELLELAESLWAHGVTIPVLCKWESDIVSYITKIANKTELPMIIYNTEETHITDISELQELDKLHNIVAIKDSSMNDVFFKEMLLTKKSWELHMSIFQWMEHKLKNSLSADWFLVALANLESKLCKDYLVKWNKDFESIINELFWKYNLWWERYISIKWILMSRWIITSAEEINTLIQP